MNNELQHAYKYTKRTWVNGKWRYEYGNNPGSVSKYSGTGKTKINSASASGKPWGQRTKPAGKLRARMTSEGLDIYRDFQDHPEFPNSKGIRINPKAKTVETYDTRDRTYYDNDQTYIEKHQGKRKVTSYAEDGRTTTYKLGSKEDLAREKATSAKRKMNQKAFQARYSKKINRG